jgi:hypothetical protein
MEHPEKFKDKNLQSMVTNKFESMLKRKSVMFSSGNHAFTHAAANDDEQGVSSVPPQQAEENKDSEVRELVDRFFNSPNGSPRDPVEKSSSRYSSVFEPEEM